MKRLFLNGLAAALILTATTSSINAQPQRPHDAPAPMEEMGEPGEPGERGERGERGDREPKEELTPEQRAIKMTEKMTQNLNLSEAQAKKIYKVNLDYINKLIEAKKLKSQHKLNVLDILDDDQSIEYLDMLSASKRKPIRKENPHQVEQGARGREGAAKGGRGGQGGRAPRKGAPEADQSEASAE